MKKELNEKIKKLEKTITTCALVGTATAIGTIACAFLSFVPGIIVCLGATVAFAFPTKFLANEVSNLTMKLAETEKSQVGKQQPESFEYLPNAHKAQLHTHEEQSTVSNQSENILSK